MLRRNLLKFGLFPLSLSARPSFLLATPSASIGLSLLRRHRWIKEEALNSAVKVEAPVFPAIHPALQSASLLFWVEANLQLVQKYRLNPLRAARTFSYLAVAFHEVAATCQVRFGSSLEHMMVGIHFAGGQLLEYLFPEEIRGKWIGKGIVLASQPARSISKDWTEIWHLTYPIAEAAIKLALTDGSARINALVQPPKHIELVWKPAPPLWSSRPAEPGAPRWRHWLVPPATGNKCPPPLTLTPEKYADEIRQVYETHQNLTPYQIKIAEDWNLDLGTVTPPGVWLKKTIDNASFSKLGVLEQTTILSLLTTTMMDAFSACWQVKFTWWTERPITAIRRLYDPQFLPHILTPSFPSYVSGHASVSGAAATILAALLPQHSKEWQQGAQEAADSRLYGGIHFRFDNEEGLALGHKVGMLALAKVSEGLS